MATDHRSNGLLILGASVRAACASARRAGVTPTGADLFADADLMAIANTMRVADYPSDFATVLADSPQQQPWLYTGGLENYPTLLDEWAALRPLLGNDGSAARRARNLAHLANILKVPGVSIPERATSPVGLPADGSWLVKSAVGSGGGHVHRWHAEDNRQPTSVNRYWQRFVPGRSCSATFVSCADEVVLLGVTEQLTTGPHHPAGEFAYAGSLGPIAIDTEATEALADLGHFLAGTCGLTGVWGVDVVLPTFGNGETVDRQPFVAMIEINPRYPAGAEVLERALGVSVVGVHVAACRDRQLPTGLNRPGSVIEGRAIVYATQSVEVGRRWASAALAAALVQPWPSMADVPPAGVKCTAGTPICTVFGRGYSCSETQRALQAARDRVLDEVDH